MKTENSTGRSLDWTARWLALLLAVTGLIALSATSCRSPGQMTTSSRSNDSLHNVKGFALIQQPVPPSVAKTTFPTKILDAIPVGTGFSKRSGQATVNVNRISKDSLEVTATCDSLARQVIILSEENVRIRNELLTQEKKPPPVVIREPTGWQWFQIWTGRIAVIALLLFLIWKVIKRRLSSKNLKT